MKNNALRMSELPDRTLLWGLKHDRVRVLSELAMQARANDTPFFWVMGTQSHPPGETIPVSNPRPLIPLQEFQQFDAFNGYSLDHPGGMKALSGDLLTNGHAASITEYVMWMMGRQPVEQPLNLSRFFRLSFYSFAGEG